MRTLTTPRKPWSFFLNFFWSKICTASMLSSVARLSLPISVLPPRMCKLYRRHLHVKALVPVRVQRLLDDARGPRLLAANRGDGEGIREACTHIP